MLQLNQLEKLTKRRRRVGRGGDKGGHSGRGHDGQKCRPGAGGELSSAFEGGQMPLVRRIPCRGFVSRNKKEYVLVALSDLERHFADGQTVTIDALREKGLVKGRKKKWLLVKVLASGSLTKKLAVHVDAMSQSARETIEKLGGSVRVAEEMSGNGSVTQS